MPLLGFEAWVKRVRHQSGQRVDWHYSGGVAQVIFIGDRDAVVAAIEANPCPARIMRWVGSGDGGIFRNFD